MNVDPNDRLSDELLAPIVEQYEATARVIASTGLGDSSSVQAFRNGRLATLQGVGDLVADVLDVAAPEWELLRRTAGVGA